MAYGRRDLRWKGMGDKATLARCFRCSCRNNVTCNATPESCCEQGKHFEETPLSTEPRLARTLLPLNTRLHLLCYRKISDCEVLAIRCTNSFRDEIRHADHEHRYSGDTFRECVPSPTTKIAPPHATPCWRARLAWACSFSA